MKLRLRRLLIAIPILASMALLSSVAARAPTVPPLYTESDCPSKLDYVVFASLADSPRFAMSAYRAAKE
jgi:hypothetical protein